MFRIIINLKNYKGGTGKKAFSLAKICKKFSKKFKGFDFILCPQAFDISEVKKTGVEVYAQHLDPIEFGSSTGYLMPSGAKQAGASGVLINHSEHRISMGQIKKTLYLCKHLKFKTILCARNLSEIKKFSNSFHNKDLIPDYIALEPPSLIGGKISLSKTNPSLILKSHELLSEYNIKLIIGAGVHCYQDVLTAKAMGASGVLVASAIVKSRNPEKALASLIGKTA